MTPPPDTLDEALSPEWLTAALSQRFPGVEVVGVTTGPVVDRISTNARFRIDCAGEPPDDLPVHLCVKGYFNDFGRLARSVGEFEAAFYRDLAGPSAVRTLRCLYADVDPDTRHGVVITEDVVAAGGEFLDGTGTYTPDQVAESLTEFARLHAHTWLSPSAAVPHLEPRMGRAVDAWGTARTLQIIDGNLNGANGIGVPSEIRNPAALIEGHAARTALTTNEPWCVIHGDAHVGNLFLDARHRPGLLDWQLVQRGRWSVDVGYHIAATLPVEVRRSAERDLLDHYLDRLAGFGVAPPGRDEAYRSLIDGIVHGLFLWAITTRVDAETIAVLLTRMGAAAADHHALTPSATA